MFIIFLLYAYERRKYKVYLYGPLLAIFRSSEEGQSLPEAEATTFVLVQEVEARHLNQLTLGCVIPCLIGFGVQYFEGLGLQVILGLRDLGLRHYLGLLTIN